MCLCHNGFTGRFCQEKVSPCKLSTCLNGGECVSTDTDPVCRCLAGFYGNACEKTCREVPCRNGGQCWDTGGGFKCQCPQGFQGALCEHFAVVDKEVRSRWVVVAGVLGGIGMTVVLLFVVLCVIIVKRKRLRKKYDEENRLNNNINTTNNKCNGFTEMEEEKIKFLELSNQHIKPPLKTNFYKNNLHKDITPHTHNFRHTCKDKNLKKSINFEKNNMSKTQNEMDSLKVAKVNLQAFSTFEKHNVPSSGVHPKVMNSTFHEGLFSDMFKSEIKSKDKDKNLCEV